MPAVPSCFYKEPLAPALHFPSIACCAVRTKVHSRLTAFMKALQRSATAHTVPLLSASTCLTLTHTRAHVPVSAPRAIQVVQRRQNKTSNKNAPEMSSPHRAAGTAAAPAEAAGCRQLPGLILHHHHRRCRRWRRH